MPEEYGYEIQYISVSKNIDSGDMSRLPSYRQLKSTHYSNHIAEILLKMYDVEELPNGTFPIKFTTINHYKQEYPGIKSKLPSTNYWKGSFLGGKNPITLLMCQDKIVVPQKLQ